MKEKFDGFEFTISPEQLLIDIEKMTFYDDKTINDICNIKNDSNENEIIKTAEKRFLKIVKM